MYSMKIVYSLFYFTTKLPVWLFDVEHIDIKLF